LKEKNKTNQTFSKLIFFPDLASDIFLFVSSETVLFLFILLIFSVVINLQQTTMRIKIKISQQQRSY